LAQSWAQEAIDYTAHRQGVPYWATHAQVVLGWALVQQGEIDKGIAYMRDALAVRTATKHLIHRPAFLGMLAEGYGLAGQIQAALQIIDEALGQVEATGERMAEAELFRLQGELLQHQQADPQQVESRLQRALDVARRQEAKSLELRATLSLSRLWMQLGKPQAAHELLAPIYGWFTEGNETSDLREARELLITLACPHSPQ
jgi:predicted ATPase